MILNPGEIFVVPKGVEHCPKADEEVGVMLLEPKGVVNTGDSGTENSDYCAEAVGMNDERAKVLKCVSRIYLLGLSYRR